MYRRLLTLLLCAQMLLCLLPRVGAAEFTDLDGHWAIDYVQEAVDLGFFNGVSDVEFDPDGTMTRAMFVTVLGRLEGIDTEYWSSEEIPRFFEEDVDPTAYYAPYISWAVCNDIVDGMTENSFAPHDPITREQMAKLVAFYVQNMGHSLKEASDTTELPFADEAHISQWAALSVQQLRSSGILKGSPNEDGSLSFLPRNTSTRAECATVFCRLYHSLLRGEGAQTPESISLSDSYIEAQLADRFLLLPEITPTFAQANLTWRSSNESAFTVEDGQVRCVGFGSATISVYTANGLSASCEFFCAETLASAEETYEQRCLRLFGQVLSNPRAFFALRDENGEYIRDSSGRLQMDYERAASYMTTVTVDVWDFDRSGNKVTRSMSFRIHKNLAPTLRQIFKEIYEGEEQFPIHYLGGFSSGGESEHTIGTAIDINPNENYYYNFSTGQQVGSYWKPGEDPYSIPLDGEVAQIFAKYGFTQGAYWNSAKDYMHFSYFAT